MALTAREEKFVEEYLKCRNGAEAARRAGYSKRSARSIANENLTKPDILAEIEARTKDGAMELDEALARLGSIARGTMEDFTSFNEGPYPEAVIDLDKARERGVLHLIKKLKYNEHGKLEIELYSALEANKFIVEMHKSGPTGTAKDPIHIKHIEVIRPAPQNEDS